MDKKIVFITGASSGIGEGCARRFAKSGNYKLILTGRNEERLARVADELRSSGCEVYTMLFDVRDRVSVKDGIDSLPPDWQQIDVLINNAGLALGLEPVQEGNLNDWDTMIDTNVKSLLFISRLIIPGMVERGSGLVINIGSTAGEYAYAGGAVYCASKAAVKILSDGMRIDLVHTPVRVTTIKPGLVETGFSVTRFHGDLEKASHVYDGIRPLTGDDVAEVVFYVASVPEYMQISDIMLMPVHQANGTVVYKNREWKE